jgi:peptidoglycan/LPS O-acetylase OafA/YrhL
VAFSHPFSRFTAGLRVKVSNENFQKPNDMEAQRSGRSIRLDVRGLRAVAVLAVLLYHANSGWLKAGFVGVDVFFVASGFIITALLTERIEKIDLAVFYLSRFTRILPTYFAMFVVVCALSKVLFLPADFSFFQESLKSAALFTSSYYCAGFGNYCTPSADALPLLHTWSLAVEMQFYLLFPIWYVLTPRVCRLPIFLLWAIALFYWSSYQIFESKCDSLYFSLLARAPDFIIGAIVALLLRDYELPRKISVFTGVLGAAFLVRSFIFKEKQRFPGLW